VQLSNFFTAILLNSKSIAKFRFREIFFRFLLTFDKKARLLVVGIRGEKLMGSQIDLLQGTLDLLILKTLALESMHGWGIAQRIQQISKDVLQVGQGSLYPALHRLEQRGWISAEWNTSDNNRRAKFYSLTRSGRMQLEKELGEWEKLSAAIALILQQS
jgi:transcriptional regulator